PETLKLLINYLKAREPEKIVLGERSGMGETGDVLSEMKVLDLAQKLGFEVVVLDDEPPDSWKKIERNGNHWLNGFYISKLFTDADKVVQTCCVKAHRFGGHFTMSLKNSVGLVAKKIPGEIYNYMGELHISPYQRSMIAEINQYYDVDVVLMDGMKAFIDKGPETGKIVEPNIMLASKDRVAIDAVGAALLRKYKTTRAISGGNIFDLEQIKRAAELGVGVKNVRDIRIIGLNSESEAVAGALEEILLSD
ncbi:MAG: DUF362 domain-containing protein, partial [Methanobacterium sp.]|nr:DUF362 domain-containing protein [Methanobacterium sp.]